MRKTIEICLIALGISFAQTASATPYIAASAEEPSHRRNEIHIGMLVGGSDVGDVGGPGVGIQLNAGRRFGDIAVYGQFDYLGVGESSYEIESPRRGSLTRGGLAARYLLLEIGERESPLGVNFWVEAGGGYQRVAWDGGGILSRNDIQLGFGLQLDGKLGRMSPDPRYFGPYFAFRANIARAPEAETGQMPTCNGPCDQATLPSRNDVSLFFNFGMHWGR